MNLLATSQAVPSALIIGTGLALVGSVFAMVAPTPYYERRAWLKQILERAGRIALFVGALVALAGTLLPRPATHRVLALAVVLAVEAVMVGLLLPVVLSYLGQHFLRRGANGKQEPSEDARQPQDDDGDVTLVRGHGAVDREQHPVSKPQDEEIGRDTTKPLSQAKKP